jgi:hypothetical protein
MHEEERDALDILGEFALGGVYGLFYASKL